MLEFQILRKKYFITESVIAALMICCTFHSLWTLLQKSDSNISLRTLQLFPLGGKIWHFFNVFHRKEYKQSTAL